MAELAEALSCADLDEYAHTVGAAADVDAVSHRVRALCDTVIDECTEETVRDRAFQTIIYRCKNSGQSELAAAYANRLPHMWASREDMLVGIYEQQADPALLHRYAAFCTDRLAKCLALLAATDRFGTDEKNRLLHQIADIVNTVYCEQDSNYYAHHLVSAYQTLAENYALARDKENTLLCLEKCVKPGFCLTPTRRKRRQPRPQCAANAAAVLSRGEKRLRKTFGMSVRRTVVRISSARSNRLPASCAGWKRIPTPENPKERKRAALCFSGPLLLRRKGLQIKKQAFALWIDSICQKQSVISPCDAAGFLFGNDDKGTRLKALQTQSYGAGLERQPPYM